MRLQPNDAAGLPPRTVMRQALRRRSAAFDGLFYAAVRSTGVVCRNVCPARPPLAANLTFYARLSQALAAGYRPCKRCRPEQRRTREDWTRRLLAEVLPAATSRSQETRTLVAGRVDTPLGIMLGVASADGLVLLEFADRPMLATQLARVTRLFRAPVVAGRSPHLSTIRREVRDWFAGRRRRFETPLVRRGTPFQEAAWAALDTIPFGETVSYQTQARVLGRPAAVRAVGTANGDNRLAIVIPCHRVRRAEGALGGYGGGVWRKRRLIDLEQAHASAVRQRGSLTAARQPGPS